MMMMVSMVVQVAQVAVLDVAHVLDIVAQVVLQRAEQKQHGLQQVALALVKPHVLLVVLYVGVVQNKLFWI